MTSDELTTLLQQELKGLTSSLEDDDFTNAIAQAQRDCGWTLPQTTDFKITWLKQRSKRHLFFYLQSEAAAKFRFKNIYLNHRFEHYTKLLEAMDKEFELAMEDNAYEFAGVSAFQAVATRIDAGFRNEPQTGRDLTYSDTNQIILTPDENS